MVLVWENFLSQGYAVQISSCILNFFPVIKLMAFLAGPYQPGFHHQVIIVLIFPYAETKEIHAMICLVYCYAFFSFFVYLKTLPSAHLYSLPLTVTGFS